MQLNRNDLLDGSVEAFLIEAERQGLATLMPPDERRQSKRQILDAYPADQDIWLFGYGSLMWNPCIHFSDRQPALIYGYHRQFCLWTPIGRGSPDCHGLVLALAPGGSCRGIAFRIARDVAEQELDLVWNREMITGAYRPRITTVATPTGRHPAITFVVNPDYPRYSGRLSLDDQATAIAKAEGRLGSCAQYLFSTVEHLDGLGINDGPMHDLKRRVELKWRHTP
jgi:cation transport protein ChaC